MISNEQNVLLFTSRWPFCWIVIYGTYGIEKRLKINFTDFGKKQKMKHNFNSYKIRFKWNYKSNIYQWNALIFTCLWAFNSISHRCCRRCSMPRINKIKQKMFRKEIALSFFFIYLFIYLFILIMKECFLCELQFFGCSVDYFTPITISFKRNIRNSIEFCC